MTRLELIPEFFRDFFQLTTIQSLVFTNMQNTLVEFKSSSTLLPLDPNTEVFELSGMIEAARVVFKPNKDNVAFLNFQLSKELLEELEITYCGLVFRGAGQLHPHPSLAIERRFLEQLAYMHLYNRNPSNMFIADMWSKGTRHKMFNRKNIWCFEPSLDLGQSSNHTSKFSCSHAIEVCDCKIKFIRNKYSACLFVHTLYYFTPKQLVSALLQTHNREAVAVSCVFPDAFGRIGEATYVRTGSEVRIDMSTQQYKHSPCDWLLKGIVGAGQYTITATRLYTAKYSVIYLLKLHNTPYRTTPAQSLSSSLKLPDYIGTITTPDMASTESLVVEQTHITKLTSVLGWCYVTTVDMEIPVSKEMIAELAVYIAGKNRTQQNYSVLMNRARNMIHRYKIPTDLKAVVLTTSVNIAFFYTIEFESGMLNSNLLKFSTQMDQHTRIHRFEPIKPSWFIRLRNTLRLATTKGTPKDQVSRLLKQAREDVDKDTKTITFNKNPIEYRRLELPLSETMLSAKTENLDIGAEVNMLPDIQFKEISGKIQNLGIVVDSRLPVAHANTAQNQYVSAVNRACPLKRKLNKNTLSLLKKFVWAKFDILFPDNEIIPLEIDYTMWNSRYPCNQRQRHDKALASLPKNCIKPDFKFNYEAFVKTEKQIWAQPGLDSVDKDPRMIQGCDDRYNVITGPPIFAIANKLKQIWNSEHCIFYPSGASAEDVGKWFALSELYYETDFSRFDSSIHKELLQFEIEVYVRLGLPKDIAKIMNLNLNSSAYTKLGVKFDVIGTRRSGTQNTSCGNSLLNGLIHAFLINEASEDKTVYRDFEYKMIVLGDDNLTCVNPGNLARCAARRAFDEVHTIFADLGLNAVTNIRYYGEEYNVEFCSSRFWPMDGSFVLGSKLGRTLAKFGWFVNPPIDNNEQRMLLYGTAMSRYYDMKYLPVLRVFSKKMIEFSSKFNGPNPKVNVFSHKITGSLDHEINPQIYEYIQLNTGVTKEQLDDVERLLEQVKGVPAVISHPVLEVLIDADL